MHTWTRSEWVKWWGRGKHDLRDFLWTIMVETHKRWSTPPTEERG